MKIKPDHRKLSYSGRIDWTNPEEPVFVFPCTSVGMRFTGGTLRIQVRNCSAYWDNYLGCILDGRQSALKLPREGTAVLEIPVEETGKKEHEVLIFKRQDACHEVAFLGAELAEGAELRHAGKAGQKNRGLWRFRVRRGGVRGCGLCRV